MSESGKRAIEDVTDSGPGTDTKRQKTVSNQSESVGGIEASICRSRVDLVFKEQPLNKWSHLKNNCQGVVNCGHNEVSIEGS